MIGRLRVSAPGRICLFGEHQDYLGLPVIAAAINLRIWIEGDFDDSGIYAIELPDIGARQEFPASFPLSYELERDYLRSVVNVLWRSGVPLPKGVRATVRGNIPINSGTASSSALCVAWTRFLVAYSAGAKSVDPFQLAKWAHQAEVVEFGEPGGMMDHVLASVGGLCLVEFKPELTVERLRGELGCFVLVDSGEAKDTKGILARVRGGIEKALNTVREADPWFELDATPASRLQRYKALLPAEQWALLAGAIHNRDITRKALRVLQGTRIDRRKLGLLLLEHQQVLRDYLQVSTPRIDSLIQTALEAGAYGAKLNGSGGGGALFAYAPEEPERVRAALGAAGLRAEVVYVDSGARVESVGDGKAPHPFA
ncbi:MAG: GHMP kinase [candidate division KSB1 bacterium]|nr:GHMP kinase [candidate division KSB1 bacterium]